MPTVEVISEPSILHSDPLNVSHSSDRAINQIKWNKNLIRFLYICLFSFICNRKKKYFSLLRSEGQIYAEVLKFLSTSPRPGYWGSSTWTNNHTVPTLRLLQYIQRIWVLNIFLATKAYSSLLYGYHCLVSTHLYILCIYNFIAKCVAITIANMCASQAHFCLSIIKFHVYYIRYTFCKFKTPVKFVHRS